MKLRKRERRAWKPRDWAYRWGKRCSDFHPECALCRAWKHYDDTGRFPTMDEVFAASPLQTLSRLSEEMGEVR